MAIDAPSRSEFEKSWPEAQLQETYNAPYVVEIPEEFRQREGVELPASVVISYSLQRGMKQHVRNTMVSIFGEGVRHQYCNGEEVVAEGDFSTPGLDHAMARQLPEDVNDSIPFLRDNSEDSE
jgi:hypothetical protein